MAEKTVLRLLVALLIISELSPGFFARLMRPSEIYDHPDDDQVHDEDSPASRKQDYLGDAHSLSGSSISFRDYQRHRQQEREAKALKGKQKVPPSTVLRKREKIDREEWERERYNRQQGEENDKVDDGREFIKSRKAYRSPNEENREESLATPNRKAEERGGGADEEFEESRSRENDHSGETEVGDKSNSQGKASVFTLPYNVIGIIVSIIWLINIIFIAWLAFGRESSDSMKIPNSSEFHPPVLTARHRPQPLVVEHKDVSGDNLNVSGISHAQAPGLPVSVTEKTPDYRPISLSLQTTKQQQQQQQLFQQPFQQQQQQQPTIRYGRQSISSDNRRLAFDDVPGVTSAYTGARRRFRNRSPSFKFTGHPSSRFDSTFGERDPERSQSSERERSERSKPKNTYKNPLSEFARYRKFDLRKSHALFEGKDNEIGERIVTAGSKSPHHRFRDKLNVSHSNTGLNDCQNKCSPSSSRESQNGKKLKNSPRVSQDVATSKVDLPRYTPSPKETGIENHLFKPNEPKDEPASLDFQMYDMNDFASIPVQIREALVCPRGSACKHSHSKFRLIGEKLFVFLKEDCKETSNIKDEAPNNVIQKTFSLKPGVASKETDNIGKVYEVSARLIGGQKHVGLSPIPQDVSTQISSKSLCSPKCKRIMNHVSMATTSTQCQFNSSGDQAHVVEIKNITQRSTVKEVHNEAKGDMLTEKSKNNQEQHTSEPKGEHKHTKVNHIKSDENKSVKNVSPGVQEPLMAPPPFGYHIRRDYSSSESTLEVVTNFKLENFENNGDPATDPNNSLEKERAQGGQKKNLGENKAVKSDDKIVSGKPSESSVKKRNCPRQEATGDGHKEHRRKAKKLMIIGKVNYFKMGLRGDNKDGGAIKPRIGFHKKIQNELKDGHAVRRERNTHDFSLQQKTSQTKQPVNTDKEHPEYDEKIIDTYKGNKVLDNLKRTNSPSSLSKDAFLYLYDSHGSGGRHFKGYRTAKNLRRRSSKIKRSTKDINYNATKLEKHNPALQAQDPNKLLKKVRYPCFNYRPMLKRNASIQKKSSVHHSTPVNLKMLPSCMLNVNTNAGSFEIVCEPEPEQQKEDKQTSNTSVQSGDQYFSTSDNPGGQPGDSDVEISQSFSFTEDKDKNDGKQASDAEVKTSGDQPLQIPEVWDDKRPNILQTCNDATKNRMQRKITEQNVPDECLNPGDKPTLGQEAAQRKGQQSPNTINKTKKKGKATEEVYIKFESMSKKITTTTLVKDGRKPLIDKFKPDRKQLPSGGDARKALPLPRERYGRKQGVDTVRHTKIMRCSDGLPGNAESRLRSKQHSETNLDSLLSVEQPRPTRVPQGCENQSLRPSESENFISSSSRTDATSFVKPVLCNSSKEIPPQESPEFCSLQNEEDTKADLTESLSEKTSAVTVVNLLNSQTCLQTGEVLEIEIEESKEKTKEIKKKTEVPSEKTPMVKVKSPEIQRSPKKREHSASLVSPKTSPFRNTKSNSRSRRRSQSDSPKSKSSDSESRTLNKIKKGTNRARSGGDVSKSSYKNDTGESSRSSKANRTTSLNGKSSRRKKSMSRSPEYKKKKRSSKKKEHSECRKRTGERSDSKAEKLKKKGDKKKHKGKKTGQSDDGSETESISSRKNKQRSRSRSRSKSPDVRKTSQMSSSSHDASFVISDHQKFSISIKRNVGSKDGTNRRASSTDEHIRNLDRDLPAIHKFKEGKTEGHASAENLTTTSEGQVRIRSAESAPTFTGTVYKAPTKVVHVVPCPKGKKSEKDLQQAEMGWNGSLTSDPNKAGTAKQTPKRNKLKYYVIKAKTNKADGTVSKLKRPSNPTDKADGDSVCSGSDQDVKTDSVSREKSGTGQIKSVQFSESIEDMEASKNDLGCDLMLLQNRPEGDAILQDKEMIIPPGESQPLERKGKTEKTAEKKDTLFVKKEAPQRSQSTPPRRKRQPIWLKKASKKPSDQNAVPDEKEKNKSTTKTASCYAPLPTRPMQHSADNLLKNSRVNIPAYYSLKPHGASPKTSTLSASDKKRGVNYNTMINRIFLTAPMNKSTRKMIAKVGSPVDIKEIIEGTPVDALDHYKTVRSPTGLRTARSVPTLACIRPDTLHAGKKKVSNEFRVMSQKKMKINKPHESESNRSVCSVDTNDGTVRGGSKNGQAENDMQISPTFSLSTDIDEAMGIKSKHGLSRFLGPGQTRRREKKGPKKQRQQTGTMEWPLMPNQEVENQADLSRIHFYGDMMECDVLNMGLSWMVQSFFNRLWFLNRPSRASNGNASGDMSSNQQIVD